MVAERLLTLFSLFLRPRFRFSAWRRFSYTVKYRNREITDQLNNTADCWRNALHKAANYISPSTMLIKRIFIVQSEREVLVHRCVKGAALCWEWQRHVRPGIVPCSAPPASANFALPPGKKPVVTIHSACSPLDPRFAGSIPAEVDGFLRVLKIRSKTSFGGEVKPSVPCRRFMACKRTLRAWIEMFRKQNSAAVSHPSLLIDC
jgi:hypothetical protein